MPLEWGVGETRVTDFILTHAEAFEVPLTVDLIRLLYEPPKREGEAGSRCTHRIADSQISGVIGEHGSVFWHYLFTIVLQIHSEFNEAPNILDTPMLDNLCQKCKQSRVRTYFTKQAVKNSLECAFLIHACKLVVMFRYKGLYAYCNT